MKRKNKRTNKKKKEKKRRSRGEKKEIIDIHIILETDDIRNNKLLHRMTILLANRIYK